MIGRIFRLLLVALLGIEMITAVLPMGKARAAIDSSNQQPGVVTGTAYALFLTVDGKVKVSGYGGNGELGLGSTTQTTVPTEIAGLNNVKQLATGYQSSYALMKDGSVKAWGYNPYYGLGLGDTTSRTTPTAVTSLSNVKQIAAGQHFAAALMNDGTVKSWGYNNYGQLGSGMTSTGTVPTQIANLTNVNQIAIGPNYMLALLNDGTIKAWGYNGNGQLGLGNTTNVNVPTVIPSLANVKQVSAGYAHALAVLNDGSLKAWGSNSYGELGIGTTVSSSTSTTVISLSNVSQVSAGNYDSIAVLTDGTVKSWGYNNYGQLGLGDTTNRTTPTLLSTENNVIYTAVGSNFTYFVKENYAIRVVGYNGNYQLGLGDTTTRTTPVDIPGLQVMSVPLQIEAVVDSSSYIGNYIPSYIASSSGSSSSFTYINGVVKAWGDNSYGQLGTEDNFNKLVPTIVPNLSRIKQLVTGYSHTLALMEDGTVMGWGYNAYGQLGIGDTMNQTEPTTISGLSGVKQLVGGTHTLALMQDGTVKSWGNNIRGQLGLGDTKNRNTPTTIPGLSGVKQLAAGNTHTFALMDDGTVKSWGYNYYYQLGLGDTINRSNPTTIPGLSGVKQLTAGTSHTLALMVDGTIKSWGDNSNGQLGLGDTINRSTPTAFSGLSGVKQLAAGNLHTLALMDDGTVKSWGYNYSGQLGLGDTINRSTPMTISGLSGIKQLVAGASHTLALSEDGTVRSWGDNSNGQLGLGDTINRIKPTIIPTIMNQPLVMVPKLKIKGQPNITTTIKYFLDSETQPKATQNYKLSGSTDIITFDSLKTDNLSKGAHTLRYEVSDGTQTVQATASFTINNAPFQNTFTTSSTTNSITAIVTSNDGGLAPDLYRITVNNQTSNWNPTNTFTANNLIPNKKYIVKFEIKDQAGNLTTETRDVYTLASDPSLTLSGTTPTTATFTISDNNPANTQYQLSTGTSTVNSIGKLTPGSEWITLTNKKLTVNGLKSGKSYRFQIKARNQEGNETASSAWIQVGPPAKPPTQPQNIKAEVNSNSVKLTWNPVQDATGYEVEINSDQIISNGAALIYNPSSLNSNTVYIYRVRAVNDGVKGPWSQAVVTRTLLPAPIVPSNIIAVPTSKTVSLQWSDVIGALNFEVEWDGQLRKTSKAAKFKAGGLLAGSQHTYRVRAVNSGGISPWSQLYTIVTKSEAPPVPVDIKAEAEDKKVHLNWNPVEDATYYEIEADGVVVINNSMSNASDVAGLEPGTTHQYRVRAVNEIGFGAWSNSISSTTFLLPTPTNISDNVQDTSIELTWGAVTSASGYDIEADGQVNNVSGTTFKQEGLTSETSHIYRIRATGASGNSGWSLPITLTTLPVKPVPPAHVNAVAGKDYVTVTWDAVTGALGYDLELDGKVVVDNFEETTYRDILLDPFTPHTYRVRAKTDAVQGDWSKLVTLATLPDFPAAPQNIRLSSSGSIATINWDADPTAQKYEIEVDGKVEDLGMHTSYKHRRIAKGSEHKYRIRTINAAGIGDWTGLIINNTMTAKLTKKETVDLGLTASDVTDFSRYTLMVNYDPNAMTVVDLSILTGTPELTTGRIEGTDITVNSFTPGQITFTTDKVVNPGESWTGVLNSIKFRATVSGGSSLTYTVIQKPETSFFKDPISYLKALEF